VAGRASPVLSVDGEMDVRLIGLLIEAVFLVFCLSCSGSMSGVYVCKPNLIQIYYLHCVGNRIRNLKTNRKLFIYVL
jgi:hypothetical protein